MFSSTLNVCNITQLADYDPSEDNVKYYTRRVPRISINTHDQHIDTPDWYLRHQEQFTDRGTLIRAVYWANNQLVRMAIRRYRFIVIEHSTLNWEYFAGLHVSAMNIYDMTQHVIMGGFDWSSSGIVTRFDHMTFSFVLKI